MIEHFEELNPAARNIAVRGWDGAPGATDPATGEPWRKYPYSMLLSVVGDVAEVKLMQSLPERGSRSWLNRIGRRLAVREFWWES